MTMLENGNIGIGTPLNENPNNYKLAVNGTIGSKEVIIENNSLTWPDYVFSQDYLPMTIYDLQEYIKLNQHLPDVPSATETDQYGISIGEMNCILLKKIEEMTLYIIDLQIQIDALKQSIEKK